MHQNLHNFSIREARLTSCVALKGAFFGSVVASPEQSAIFVLRGSQQLVHSNEDLLALP